jgi:hypothetical protein
MKAPTSQMWEGGGEARALAARHAHPPSEHACIQALGGGGVVSRSPKAGDAPAAAKLDHGRRRRGG